MPNFGPLTPADRGFSPNGYPLREEDTSWDHENPFASDSDKQLKAEIISSMRDSAHYYLMADACRTEAIAQRDINPTQHHYLLKAAIQAQTVAALRFFAADQRRLELRRRTDLLEWEP